MDSCPVAAQDACFGPGVRIPEADGLIERGRDQLPSIFRKLQTTNRAGMPLEETQELACSGIPNMDVGIVISRSRCQKIQEYRLMTPIERTSQFVHERFGEGFVPLHEPRFRGKEKNYLSDVIDSTFVSYAGKFVDQLEDQIKGIRYQAEALRADLIEIIERIKL